MVWYENGEKIKSRSRTKSFKLRTAKFQKKWKTFKYWKELKTMPKSKNLIYLNNCNNGKQIFQNLIFIPKTIL